MVTIYDIAKKSGYSPTTVSKALNDYPDISASTKMKIRAIAREMGYTPNSSARALATSKSWLIGILYNEDQGLGIRHPHFSEIIEKFKERIEEAGYELIFIGKRIGERHNSVYEHCLYRGVDAVFIVNHPEVEGLQDLINSRIPCVASEPVPGEVPCVLSDNVDGAKKAVDYLFSLGHKRVAHIAGPLSSAASQERIMGYKMSVQAHNTDYGEGIIEAADQFNFKSGYEAMQRLLDMHQAPTAVFCSSDVLACGAIAAARERGLYVPEDISIIGFDDIEIAAYVVPGLTTVRQNRAEIGQTCAEILLKMLDGRNTKPKTVRIPTRLIIRNSCRRYIE
ncbi:LacI family DNA-binding transcriptional regulator [Thermoclostridium caenicola]|uniref:Transcriptional regulator, LacI family n=1 Tax=Thermoclostridium caenicola TaxID=659425 RepID=A0A1M6J7Z3_9FIRM|nr:LacI family DNA-binding transcriptional regulator [Thermoclostridium caenicola]SHJ42782.1 transcriptional regulator, LacI family [Thermoclostridium caenicola]HOP72271.1 LacI family DNA-binding transcriptional regulator [Thermoclostridium caenicola]